MRDHNLFALFSTSLTSSPVAIYSVPPLPAAARTGHQSEILNVEVLLWLARPRRK